MICYSSVSDREMLIKDPSINAIYFDDDGKERIYQALFRGTNTLSPPDMELIKLLEDMKK